MRVDVFWENDFNVYYFLYISFLELPKGLNWVHLLRWLRVTWTLTQEWASPSVTVKLDDDVKCSETAGNQSLGTWIDDATSFCETWWPDYNRQTYTTIIFHQNQTDISCHTKLKHPKSLSYLFVDTLYINE